MYSVQLLYSVLISHSVNCVYQKMLLKENESYLVLVGGQFLLVTINNVY